MPNNDWLRRRANFPGDVSDVYWLLRKAINDDFPKLSKAHSHVLLALSYTKYSEAKKKICESRRVTRNQTEQQLRLVHSEISDPTTISNYLNEANESLIGYSKEAGSRFGLDAIKKTRPKLWDEVASHLVTLCIVGIFLFIKGPIIDGIDYVMTERSLWAVVKKYSDIVSVYAARHEEKHE